MRSRSDVYVYRSTPGPSHVRAPVGSLSAAWGPVLSVLAACTGRGGAALVVDEG
jgi:hypothetical protein